MVSQAVSPMGRRSESTLIPKQSYRYLGTVRPQPDGLVVAGCRLPKADARPVFCYNCWSRRGSHGLANRGAGVR